MRYASKMICKIHTLMCRSWMFMKLGAIVIVTAKLPLLLCPIGKYYWKLDSRICLHSWMLCWCN